MRTLRTSVRRLVEFVLRSGDIDSQGGWRNDVEAMRAGSDIHRMLQASGGDHYQAEVPLACSVFFPNGSFSPHAARLEIGEQTMGDQDGFFLRVEGRADGIIDDGAHHVVVDEIKGVSRDVASIAEPAPVHEAQALCYAYLHLRATRGSATLSSAFGERVVVRLTYASMTTGEVRQIEHAYAAPDIEARFFCLLEAAQRWAAWRVAHDELRGRSLVSLELPFEPRDAQRQMMDAVTHAIRAGKRLYVQAPTGSGKTIAALYPVLRAMGTGEVSRIAYLTAKTTTRHAALECLDLFRQQDFAVNVLVVTARDKLCPLRSNASAGPLRARPLSSLCNPVECPLARGHYDAVNDALYDAIASYDVLDAKRLGEVAQRHHVCPYELQRDVTRWADVIVCDYHHAFAPSAGLFGLADEPSGDVVFLVDEAHNLVERMRDMYSAELSASELKGLERRLPATGPLGQLVLLVRAVRAAFPSWDNALPAPARDSPATRVAKREAGRRRYQRARLGDDFVDSLTALANGIDDTLGQFLSSVGAGGGDLPTLVPGGPTVETYLALRDMGYKVRAFVGALQRSEVGYVTFVSRGNDGALGLTIYCVDPSHDLGKRLEQAKAAVFFSGTLLPMEYHRTLLAARDEDASLFVTSSFDPRHLQVLVGSDVNTRYSKRGPLLYARIASYLVALVRARPGNYLAFFPSHAMAEEVQRALGPLLDAGTTVVRQIPGLREEDRDRFVSRFRAARRVGSSLVGLCVLGGIFGESINLPGKALVGVVVVGTGMPRASAEREVIRDHFDTKGDKGFAYAYTYPGLIKVLQAAGRLIRTETDEGVLLLLDDRFLEGDLQEEFPQEWQDVKTCTLATMPRLLG